MVYTHDGSDEQGRYINLKKGYLNDKGETVIPVEYEEIEFVRSSEDDGIDYFWVKQNGLWGILAVSSPDNIPGTTTNTSTNTTPPTAPGVPKGGIALGIVPLFAAGGMAYFSRKKRGV